MTPTRGATDNVPFAVMEQGRLSRRGRAALVAGLVIGAVLLGLAARRPAGDGAPLDPEGTGRLGVKALVLLLSEGGADVKVSARTPDASRATAVVLSDTFDRARRNELMEWVSGGGTLVVADPGSPLGMVEPYFSPVTGDSGATRLDDRCSAIPALSGIRSIEAGGSLVYGPEGRRPGAVGCFSTDDGDFLVATPRGAGTVVALGGAGLWVNDHLDERDNAGLAVALLAPGRSTATQVVSDLAPDAAEIGAGPSEGRSVLSVLPIGVKVAGLQLVLVFIVAVAWRARRLGRPVGEVQPVEVPGSELVIAVGHLHQRGGHRARAAAVLTGRARRRVADRLGLPRSTPTGDLARMATDRAGVDGDRARAGLVPVSPHDDAALLRVAVAADAIERAVSGRLPTSGDELA